MAALIPFPEGAGPGPETPPFLRDRGYRVRRAVDADIPRLRQLYADTRAEEMAGVPWSAQARQGFLDQQFELQHQHYLHHYAGAEFLAIDHEGVLEGRYYLLRSAPEHLVVDICLMRSHRGRGIGRALIDHSLRGAASMGCGVGLSVLRSNARAQALYQALGFEAGEATDTHLRMHWRQGAGAV